MAGFQVTTGDAVLKRVLTPTGESTDSTVCLHLVEAVRKSHAFRALPPAFFSSDDWLT